MSILFNPLSDHFTCLECEYTYDEWQGSKRKCPECEGSEIESLFDLLEEEST